ncbi:hypothetical protein TH53_26350 [Pedobacter lusitanus]|uniref:Contig200, whole genome shotgun sequence n=1 Tax=Pedobacter lusitanus TaxID=1503925 RepID=A0A0D0GJ88_9SPHI|nr:hypothetical protein TH53_26350 [Pedobacter lusitanus]
MFRKDEGNVVVLKLDGLRYSSQYTVFITLPITTQREVIRVEDESLKEAIVIALNKFIKI